MGCLCYRRKRKKREYLTQEQIERLMNESFQSGCEDEQLDSDADDEEYLPKSNH